MSITVRMGGLSVVCDTCGHGGFIGTHDEATALAAFNLMASSEKTHRCLSGCSIQSVEEEEP